MAFCHPNYATEASICEIVPRRGKNLARTENFFARSGPQQRCDESAADETYRRRFGDGRELVAHLTELPSRTSHFDPGFNRSPIRVWTVVFV